MNRFKPATRHGNLKNDLNYCVASMVVVVALGIIGCGDKASTYPVTGKLTYPDGSPVPAAVITFKPLEPPEGIKPISARGFANEDGTYVLTTFQAADGAMAGRHRVIIMEPYSSLDKSARPPSRGIAAKYSKYETSGLEFEVKDEPNEINITVEPAKK